MNNIQHSSAVLINLNNDKGLDWYSVEITSENKTQNVSFFRLEEALSYIKEHNLSYDATTGFRDTRVRHSDELYNLAHLTFIGDVGC